MQENVVLFPIPLSKLESLIKVSVASAIALASPEQPVFEQDQRLTVDELCKYLHCTRQTVYKYKREGIFPYYQTGRTIYFKKAEVDAALSSQPKKKKG